jgi:DNA repair exonuclease SbcCD nuclease subunit
MKTIIVGDPHIVEEAIPELEKIFSEVLELEGDTLIMLGDYFDKRKPSAKEVIFGTKWAFQFKNKFKQVIYLRGNHDRTKDVSVIDYLAYFGIEVVDEYTDEDNNYYGHFMTNKSLYEYGSFQHTVAELRHYNRVILGHQHSYQEIEKNMWHIGSCRFVNFNEVTDKNKKILILNNGTEEFLILKNPIKMEQVKSVKELPNMKNKNMKIRLVISSYEQFKKEVNLIKEYRDTFADFKLKLDFTKMPIRNDEKMEIARKKKLSEVLEEGISKIKDEDVKTLIREALK